MNLLRPLAALLLLAAPLSLSAQDQTLPRANAIEEDAVRALLGKKAIISGKVTDTFESPKGMTFLNLDGGKFTVVAWKDVYDKFEGGSPAKLYKDKTIEITGLVFEFRNKNASKEDPGKLEIKLTTPDQIKVLTLDEPPADGAEPDKKKEAGEKSPPVKKEAKEEKPDPAKKDTKPADPGKETPERVDPKKYFK